MDKRLAKIMESGARVSFVMLLIFTIITAFFKPYIAAAELVLVILTYIYYRQRMKRRSADIRKYVETLAFQVDDASKHSLVNFPLPMTIMRLDSGEIVWTNELFDSMTKTRGSAFEQHITDVVPGFDTRWVMEGKPLCPYDVEMNERKYNIYGNIVRSGPSYGEGLLATLFWVDVTEYSALRVRYERSRPVVAIVVIDSYEELFKGMSETEKSSLTAEIDMRINEWCKPAGGIVRRLDRDRYLFIFENHALLDFSSEKFSILDSMRELQSSDGISATLSLGIGKGDCDLHELYQYAALAIDMALSRGGDQVVIKSKNAFEFFGGKSKEIEKRTKVKSRVMANALAQLIKDSSQIFVMGHKVSDLDSVGAAAGVCALARKCGKKPYLLVDESSTSAGELVRRLKQAQQYSDVFITEEDAILLADPYSMVIVVDTNRPEITEAPQLLETVKRIVVIDHHRRAASYIENCAISMHETYASSACELVAELLQYIITPQDILKIEAEGLLAGIVLDTKSFTVKTGVRTFEASAYLKQLGADTVEVRKMFSGGLETYIKKYQLIATAEEAFPGISMVVYDEDTDRVVAAQAADELINITNVQASFVIYGENGGAAVSARSYGDVNVQYVMEKVGGGGSLTMAGAQFRDKRPAEVKPLLCEAIREYLDENSKEK